MIGDNSGDWLGYAFSPRLRASQAGWFVLGLGLIITAATIVALWRGCPVLELTEEGIAYTRCLQGTIRIAWSEFDHAEVKRATALTSSGPDIDLEEVVIHTKDQRRIAIAPVAPVSELLDAITSMAKERREKRTGFEKQP